MSGFFEKEWYSLRVKSSPPRLVIDKLVNGYRKIPIAQEDADIYCDSKLISREFFNSLSLIPDSKEDKQSEVFENDIFKACLNSISPVKLLSAFFRLLDFSEFLKTTKDRLGAAKEFNDYRMHKSEALFAWSTHLKELNRQLESDFILGKNPSYLDFCAYHLIWFHIKITNENLSDELELLIKWYERMEAFGHGSYEEVTEEFAFQEAKRSMPKEIRADQEHSKYIGKEVFISPSDYMKNKTKGMLVGATDYSWILSRDNSEYGLVHIHFPKRGFELTSTNCI